MRRRPGFAPVLLALVAAACGTESDPKPDTQEPIACGRYEALVDGSCEAVTVLGLAERKLSFTRDGYTLHGTLTMPVAVGDYLPPVFVLVHGSGPNDRDETTDANLGVTYGQDIRTFAMLADGLGDAGAAVYRYDKRTCFRENSASRCPTPISAYPGNLDDIMVDDFIDDLRAAVREVASLPDVDGNDITVVGHSMGANFVPLLVGKEPGVVAGVQLAGSSLPIDQVAVGQIREFADLMEELGAPARDVDPVRAMADELETGLAQIRSGTWAETHYEGIPTKHWQNWMERTDHLEEDFLSVDEPLLLLNGDWDFNVAPHHLERFQGWAEAAGKKNAEFVLVPGATHAFVTLTNGGRGLDPNFSPIALEAIVEWHQRTAP